MGQGLLPHTLALDSTSHTSAEGRFVVAANSVPDKLLGASLFPIASKFLCRVSTGLVNFLLELLCFAEIALQACHALSLVGPWLPIAF